jgi:DNA mismatch repair protein MutS2
MTPHGPLHATDRALERLEWWDLVARLRGHAHTPAARARCAPPAQPGDTDPRRSLFARDEGELRRLLRETSEARALLDRGQAAPVGDLALVGAALRRAAKGGALGARELLDLRATLAALHATERFLARHADVGPTLALHLPRLPDLRELEREIEHCLDPEGEVRDAASPALADGRREARELAAELQRRLAAYLHEPEVAACLSDSFVTVRNDRFVLPVRADARGRVRGIVHDASSSGTTLFIEPEAAVDLNNRLKHAELTVERETQRVLRDLSQQTAAALPLLEPGLEALEEIDLAFARGRLSQEQQGVEPEVGDAGALRLNQLRHPLLSPERVVPNDLRLGDGATVLVLSGPNAGGKTVALKALGLAVLAVRAGLHVPAEPGARVDWMDAVLVDLGDEQNLRESLSTFSAHVANLARIVDEATPSSLVLVDEIGAGTDPSEGATLAQAILEALADAGARVVATTHFNLLKEMAAVDPRFANASVEFDPETLAPTYRLRLGVAGTSSAMAVAARMGLRRDVLERANALLEREDRRLDRMLSELAASRVALDRERSEASRLRTESEAARAEYRAKLERLQERRDELFRSMRQDLDRAFRSAHAEVAAVIRDLQRGVGARDAAHARERLQALAEKAREAEATTRAAEPETAARLEPVDWRHAKPGDPVRIEGGGEAVLLALPDRRGRVSVRTGAGGATGGARLLVPIERVGRPLAGGAPAATPARPKSHVALELALRPGADGDAPAERCDLRGLRVEEALGRVAMLLDRAAATGRARLLLVHGLGTGALRDAIRARLAESPYVDDFAPGAPEEGGDGVTRVRLAAE